VNRIQLIILAVEGGLVATAAILTIWAVSAQVGQALMIIRVALALSAHPWLQVCHSGFAASTTWQCHAQTLCVCPPVQVAFRRYAVYCVFMLVPSGRYPNSSSAP
jgi:hypothetical protein